MKNLYVVIWHEAIEVSDLVAGIFNDEQNAIDFKDKLVAESSGDYWEVITKDAPID